jgi:replicative DNA helicase
LVRHVPPQNLQAEQAVLGGVFLKSSILNNLVDIVTEDDFYSPAHRTTFQAFQELSRKSAPIDLLTVSEELARMGKLDEVGGAVYLAEIATSVVSAANALHYAHIVKEKSVQRQLIGAAAQIISDSYAPGKEVDALVDEAQQAIFHIAESRTTRTYKSSKELVDAVFKQLEERVARKEMVTGVPTDYQKFDELTAGLQPSDLIICAGRPAMGKTAFALNLAMRAAVRHAVPTVVFSLEMSMEQLMMRMLCIHARTDLKNLRRGFLDDSDWAKLYDAADVLTAAPLYIDDTPAISVMELRARCRRLKYEKGLGLIVVDYLQLMRASRNIDSREQEISDISRNLKALAKELNLPVLALSQLNRKVEERSNRRPMLSDLRESGAIEQDADIIIFIYRDVVYNKDTPNPNSAEVIIGKQRNGPTGVVELRFFGESTAFEDVSHMPEPSEYGVRGI